MENVAINQKGNPPVQERIHQAKWQRVILLSVLAYEGLGCLAGGIMLILAPDGHLMDMPVSLMHGTFADFLIPGIILFALGVLTVIAFFSVLRKSRNDWLFAALSMNGLAIWFWVEIAILLELHWLHAMWGLPVVAGGLAALSLFSQKAKLRGALICGILASFLYLAINILVPQRWPAYNSLTQTVSELSAVGAPTRFFWIVLSTPYTILSVVFAYGLLKAAGKNRRLRLAGVLLFLYGSLGVLWPFAPMHLRETLAAGGGTISDTMHLTLGAVTEVIYLIALGVAATALGKGFRWYSIITFVMMMVFGVLTFLEAPDVGKNLPTPFIGLWERINIGLFLLWVIVLAEILLSEKPEMNQMDFTQNSDGFSLESARSRVF